MATVYSLICWGGSAGVGSWGRSTNQLTKTDHGLNKNGFGVRFSGGTLPTSSPQVNTTTTYYVKVISTSNIELYTDSALTSQITFSATGSGWVLKSQAVADPATFFAAHSLSDLTRWDTRIYAGTLAWATGRSGASALDSEIAEIADSFIEYKGSVTTTVNLPCASWTLTSAVNGVRSPAFHNGIFATGYILSAVVGYSNGIASSNFFTTFDGFSVRLTGEGWAVHGVSTSMPGAVIANMLIYRESYNNGGNGLYVGGQLSDVYNCKIYGFGTGIYKGAGSDGGVISNNIVFGNYNSVGAYSSTSIGSYWYNNIFTEQVNSNWPSLTGYNGASNNAGKTNGSGGYTGGTPWGSNPVALATTDFVSWNGTTPYLSDLRPAAVTSPQVETGTSFYGNTPFDAALSVRPAYPGSAHNTAVTAGSFVAGLSYTIASVGTTDFTLIGASASTVGVTFKATGVGTGTGTATLNAKYDIGAHEYDLGYGSWPQTQTITIYGYATGSRVSINKQSDGTEIYNSDSPSWPQTTSYTSDTAVYVYIRKASSATYYHPVKLAGTIDPDTGLTLDATGLQVEDIAAASYDAQIDTDWGINWSTGAITHDSGTTRYSVQGIYSMHQNESDSSTNIDAAPLMHGTTPTQFELINSGSISAGDLEDLYGGSIEFQDGTLWSNLWTTDTMAAAHDLYIVQGTSKYTAFWSSGPIDVLIKAKNAGSLISSGLVTVYARPYGYTYANYTANLSAGGRVVAPIATLIDPAITETAVTVGGWTDIGVTFGTYSLDFGDGDGAQTYYCRIDCNGRPLSQVYQRMQYITRDVSTATLNGVEGWRYASAHTGYTANTAAPFGTYSGGVWSLAKGVWLDNVPSGDSINYIVTDDSGTTHQNTVALNQSVSITGVTAGSRVQIYDLTNGVELFNDTTSPYYWEDPSAPVGDREIRVRIAYVSGATAKGFIEALIGTCGTSSSTKDVSYLAAQVDDGVYNANAVDGSAVTGVTFTDSTIDKMNIDIVVGEIGLDELYAAWVRYAFTDAGIRTDIDYIRAIDTANYVYYSLVWKNTTSPSVPLKITGGYAWDAVTLDPIDLMDTTGGTIFLAPPHVVAKTITVAGGYVVTGSQASIVSAIFSQAESTPIKADLDKVLGNAIGEGSTSNASIGYV